MAYDFHYTPTGTGVISGKEVLEQTEDAINDLGNTAISGVQEALDKAEQALTNSENAVDDAQTALNTANNAEGVAIQAQTDVGNLSGTVTNIGNRVTTAEGNITNLQGRMTTAESNIGNLQGRMTTAETNIGNLQTAVSTAQATANSAQQTATTARQQSYVFRYSSTALTPSSTNSNTLLDNTDNLKVGDKIIDNSGVLFSITAIDSVNSTFTIGTALIDLAQDSDVVHKSGNETISGDKVFNNRLIKNIDVVLGTAPNTSKFSNIDIADNNKLSLLQIMGGVYDTGNSYARFFVQNKTADDGTGLSPTGTIRSCGFNINLPATSTSDGQGSITPRANKTTDFGLATYQWRNLWCEKLFLNGTQLDPSAFVTTNTNQTISGQKLFDDINIVSSSSEIGVSGGNRSYKVFDKNKKTISSLEGGTFSSGMAYSYWLVNNGSDVFNGVTLYQPSANLAQLRPYNSTLSMQLGASNRYFTDCYTSKVNNLEPSSLSLPVAPSSTSYVDISSYITVLDSSAPNTYTPPSNGYITFNVTGNLVQIFHDYGLQGKWSVQAGNANRGFIPVLGGVEVKIYVSASNVDKFWFIPCQGNV